VVVVGSKVDKSSDYNGIKEGLKLLKEEDFSLNT